MLQKRTILVGESILSYFSAESAAGAPILFLHGWRSEARVWQQSLDAFAARGYGVYALDLPGFGASESPSRPFSVHDYADVVRGFMQKLTLTNVILVGHSFGGRIAIVFAAEHPELVSRLVLVDSAGIRESNLRRDSIGVVAKIASPFFRLPFLASLRRTIYRSMGADDYLATPELQETFKLVIAEDLQNFLPKIVQPTLLVWGENDTDTPLSYGNAMEKVIPDVRLVVIPGAGHFSFLDDPDRFISALRAFIV